MASFTLNPQKVSVPARDKWTNRVKHADFYPAVGNRVAVLFLEAEPANVAAIVALLDQIEALCVDSDRVDWVATAEPGFVPAARVKLAVDPKGTKPVVVE